MPFSRKKQLLALDQQVKSLRAELYTGEGQIRDRLDSVEGIIDGHDATLDTSTQSLESLQATVGEYERTIDEQRATIAALTGRLDALDAKLSAQATQNARIEARLTEITEQVLRQVEELGNEVDAATRLAQQAAESTGVPGGVLDDLKAAQTKLASEQVRYDLALRAELAELADRLRRTGRG